MQDPKNGEMLSFDQDQKRISELVYDGNAKVITNDSCITSIDPIQPKYSPDELKLQAEKQGYCILSVGEEIDIKGKVFKVHHFDKKFVMLECPLNISDFKMKIGEELSFKKGRFVVSHYGPMFMKLRGLPGNNILNQVAIDEYHKQEIKRLQKKGK